MIYNIYGLNALEMALKIYRGVFRMKKIFTLISAVVVSLMVMCVTAFAATEDVELSVTRAMATNGQWGQSITYSKSDFDASRITPESQVMVEYEVEGEMPASGCHPVELIFKRY